MQPVVAGDETVQSVQFANDQKLGLICGPCAIENRDLAMKTAETLKQIADELKIGLVYKSSFDKANRTSADGPRGAGLEEGLKILQQVRETFHVPVCTDIHRETQAKPVSEVADILQIPAFLCRQTDLIAAACETGKVVNLKKGQFLSPHEMLKVADKAARSGCGKILLTERGASFGYNNLVTDIRSLQILKESRFPVIFDATHSVQLPGGGGTESAGQREFIECLARAAVSAGISGLFIESHPDPDNALSDRACMVPMNQLKRLLQNILRFDEIAKQTEYISMETL
ncbi:3-deoxy-8-phosphooctulonate synthase [bacterium]|nr:3-deoxy-8-phosphooctulonate synthase [bacterium]